MNLSLIDKFGVIFKYIGSSFLSIEMFVFSLLLFLVLVFNLKRDNRVVQMIAIGIYIGFVIGFLISYNTYVKTCVNSFVKRILNYIYFPSTIVYFFIMVFVTGMILYSVFSKKLTKFIKVINYLTFSSMYFFFMSFVALCAYYSLDLVDITVIYQNDTILSLVQMSNFILVLWVVFTCFYQLFRYFKNKYD